MGFNWGNVSHGPNGWVPDELKGGEGQGSLEFISDSLKGAIDRNGKKMDDLMKALEGDASNPALLAQYQAIFAQWAQANQLRASAVQKASEVDTEIMRKA
jgi:hypothetical protein